MADFVRPDAKMSTFCKTAAVQQHEHAGADTCTTAMHAASAIPAFPKSEASVFRSLAVLFWLGFINAARNLGGSPYLRMLSTNSRIAQMWIHALKACASRALQIRS